MQAYQAYDLLAPSYDEKFSDPLSLAENRLVRSLVAPHIPLYWDDAPVLDLGCGTGLLLELFPRAEPVYTGVDLSVEMLCRAGKKFPSAKFYRRDMAYTEFRSWSFGSVVSLFGTASYCLDLRSLVHEIHRVLRPGGTAFITFFGKRQRTRKRYIAKGFPNVTRWFYSAEELRDAFARKFPDPKVRGIEFFGDLIPGLTERGYLRYLRAETKLLSRRFPNLAYTLSVEVKKEEMQWPPEP